ncbi:MAG TPA: NADH-quinone oxidoreductase subunit A [Nitrospiraceae bacterium]|nr:NADH-quinone oxidoreductase subunit A [Nitrospiraceae bacterium]
MDLDNNVWPLLFYFAAVLIVVAGMIGLPYVLGERHGQNSARHGQRGTDEPYESGIIPTGTARLRLPIQYYLAAMFFVIFDLEAVFIYAWAIAVPETGWGGFGEMALFIAILLVALAYLWRVGALNWGAHYWRAEAPSEELSKEKHDAMVA